MTHHEKIGIERWKKIVDGKSFIVSGDVHTIVKDYCKTKNINFGLFCEKTFMDVIRKDETYSYIDDTK